jgi:hypothetical protein
VGCHVYLHSLRIPLALTLDKVPIISGERERHNGSIKINQIPEALSLYQNLTEDFGVQLLLPLRHMPEGDRIANLLGFDWQEGKEQLGCVLSGNYRLLGGSVDITARQIQKFVEEFAGPCAKKIIESYATGRIPNHLKIATQILGP